MRGETFGCLQDTRARWYKTLEVGRNREKPARFHTRGGIAVWKNCGNCATPDVCFRHSLAVLQGCPWDRHAPAWLLEPGWSPALPGGGIGAGLTKWTSRARKQ